MDLLWYRLKSVCSQSTTAGDIFFELFWAIPLIVHFEAVIRIGDPVQFVLEARVFLVIEHSRWFEGLEASKIRWVGLHFYRFPIKVRGRYEELAILTSKSRSAGTTARPTGAIRPDLGTAKVLDRCSWSSPVARASVQTGWTHLSQSINERDPLSLRLLHPSKQYFIQR